MLNASLYDQARAKAQAERRTIAGQIEFLALMGRTALDNPDLLVDCLSRRIDAVHAFVPEGKCS